jgi:dCMP deaminase
MDQVRTLTGSRPSSDQYFLDMALVVASRSTCARRAAGCVLVNEYGYVIATGHNGVYRGGSHCIESPCPGAGLPSGTGLHLCEAIHAEENALIQCSNINAIHTVYCTSSPCLHCMRRLAATSVKRIVFSQRYPHVESERIASQLGIQWVYEGPNR